MKFGVNLINFGPGARPESLTQWAMLTETLGYHFLMTSDHLGSFIATPMQPGELLLGTKGYSFGLGFAVRTGDGVAGVPGSAGEYLWAGYGGTFFWVDPKEQLTAVLMTQAASPQRAYFRKLVKQLTYQAITD